MRPPLRRSAAATLLLASAALAPVLALDHLPAVRRTVGGGFTDGGLSGEYFANPRLEGTPAFSRQDVRLAFDWGVDGLVGGSTAEPFASFPRDGFSVRWTGALIPRFSEPYTFHAGGDDVIRVRLRPRSNPASAWIDLVETGPGRTTADSRAVPLVSGATYDVVVEFRDLAGPASCWLAWSSPSTPPEPIEPIAGHGLNLASWYDDLFADLVLTARWVGDTRLGDDGWPTTDGQLLAAESIEEFHGTLLLQFNGRAEVTAGGSATFSAGAESWQGTAPAGAGWDAASNTTTLRLRHNQRDGHWHVRFRSTQRTPDAPVGSGLTNLRLMRARTPGGDEPHPVGTLVQEPMRNALRPYTVLRWLQSANQRVSGRWADRTLPSFPAFTRGGQWSDNSGGETWERLVAIANETGKDLSLCLPMQADDDYLLRLARLLRFGSDGRDPYAAPTPNPVFPPLNPNLRIYLEMGNEIWNWGFGSTQFAREESDRLKAAGDPAAAIFNYDGRGNYRTWHAQRTVELALRFAEVFGREALNNRVRVVLQYQYDNAQETALQSFRFLDAWYGNGTGSHVPQAFAPRDLLWGAGGATYYGTGNSDGTQDRIGFRDGGFESVRVAAGGRLSPPVGPWRFTGPAGLYRNSDTAFLVTKPGPSVRLREPTALGIAFRSPSRPMFVKELGRWFGPRGDGSRQVILVRASDGAVLATADVQPRRGFMERSSGRIHFAPAIPASGGNGPVRLEASTEYHLLSLESPGQDALADATTTLASPDGLEILGTIRAPQPAAGAPVRATPAGDGPAATALSLRFGFAEAVVPTGFPEPPQGTQAGWLSAGGAIEATVEFDRPGDYAIAFNAAGPGGSWPGYPPFRLSVDGTNVSPRSQRDFRTAPTFSIGGFHRPVDRFTEQWGSAVFRVDRPGPRVVRLEALPAGDASTWLVVDDFQLRSVDAILETGFGAGSAFGQVAQDDYQRQLDNQAAYARLFGLEVVAYEAGWSLGGDFHAAPIQMHAKFRDPRARTINNEAMDIFMRSGGTQNIWGVYVYWPPHDMPGAFNYPLMQSIVDLGRRLPAAPVNGNAVQLPATLTPDRIVRWRWNDNRFDGSLSERGQWCGWLLRTDAPGTWEIALDASGPGSVRIEIDGKVIGTATAGAQPVTVTLPAGLHGLRLRLEGAEPLRISAIHTLAR